jgi:hypothetical protein
MLKARLSLETGIHNRASPHATAKKPAYTAGYLVGHIERQEGFTAAGPPKNQAKFATVNEVFHDVIGHFCCTQFVGAYQLEATRSC